MRLQLDTFTDYLFLFLYAVFLTLPISLCAWFNLRQLPPTFTLVDFRVPTSNYPNNLTLKCQDVPDITFSLEIQNPNKVYTITYNNFTITTYYNRETLGETEASEFEDFEASDNVIILGHLDTNIAVWANVVKVVPNSLETKVRVELKTKIKFTGPGCVSKEHDLRLEGCVNVGSDGKIYPKGKQVELGQDSC